MELPGITAGSAARPSKAPTVRVLTPLQHGTLSIRKAVLATNGVAGCAGLKTPTQIAFYQANDYAGLNKVSFEVTSESREVATYENLHHSK